MKYEVRHTCDETGGRYPTDGPLDLETDALDQAIALADELTERGQCGYVRDEQGRTRCPDGTWV